MRRTSAEHRPDIFTGGTPESHSPPRAASRLLGAPQWRLGFTGGCTWGRGPLQSDQSEQGGPHPSSGSHPCHCHRRSHPHFLSLVVPWNQSLSPWRVGFISPAPLAHTASLRPHPLCPGCSPLPAPLCSRFPLPRVRLLDGKRF